ncbi:hypothetical protein [Geodermatophilus sp. SYSU D00766]
MAVLGAVFHRRVWLLLLVPTLMLVTQSPSRTATLSLLVSTVTFGVLVHLIRGSVIKVGRLGAVAATCLVVGATYFSYIGSQLDKSDLPSGLAMSGWVPPGMGPPLLYELGGLSAFSVLADAPVAGNPYGSPGRSVYVVMRVLSLFGVKADAPAPFASYVSIPTPFNVYSAFGDAYFDAGLPGVVVIFFVVGAVIAYAWRRAMRGSLPAAWVVSVLASVLLATPLSLRFANVDVWIQALFGALVVYVLTQVETRNGPVQLRQGDEIAAGRGDGLGRPRVGPWLGLP